MGSIVNVIIGSDKIYFLKGFPSALKTRIIFNGAGFFHGMLRNIEHILHYQLLLESNTLLWLHHI